MIFNPVMDSELLCLRQTSDDLDRSHSAFVAAAQRGEMEEVIAFSLHVFGRMMHWNTEYVQAVQDGKRPYVQAEQDKIEANFRVFHQDGLKTCDLARRFLEQGFELEGLDALRRALRSCPYVDVGSRELIEGYEEGLAGNTVDGEQVRDEIQARVLQARGGTAR